MTFEEIIKGFGMFLLLWKNRHIFGETDLKDRSRRR